jgi:hypothetical protein
MEDKMTLEEQEIYDLKVRVGKLEDAVNKSNFSAGLCAEPNDYKEKYFELIMGVANKFPDETRHETALRYIKERERGSGTACSEKST